MQHGNVNHGQSQLTQGLCLVSNCKKCDDPPLSKSLLVIVLIKVTVTVTDGRAALTKAAGIITAVQAVILNIHTLIALLSQACSSVQF